MLKQELNTLSAMWMQWLAGIQYEIDYWDRWVACKGGSHSRDFEARIKPCRPVDEMLGKVIDRLRGPQVEILDVGAGPITCIGTVRERYQLKITATDPLAAQYKAILEKNDLTPPVTTQFALGEELELFFDPEKFDVVHCQNALDHSLDPVQGLLQMLMVCRIGGYVMLRHAHNEAEHEKYSGFHQWNLTLKNTDFIIWKPGIEINFSDEVAGFADHEVLMSDGYLINVFRKRHDVPRGLAGDVRRRMSAFQESVVGSLGVIPPAND